MTKRLNTLRPGERGIVEAIHGDSAVTQRLAEMGMVPGATCEVVRYAPLGDPIDILLDGYHLSLRKRDAAHVSLA
ncbi:MAG: ferrous iron transport protein A [Deltaproteobacteria bacterium]|nr:ferrous iron transport protein A [Deltaproteobacteria bacterium]